MTSTRLFAVCALATLGVSATAHAQQTVAVAPFKSIELRGGGHVVLRHGAIQRVTILKGSTEYTRFRSEEGGRKLAIDACVSHCPMRYDLEIEIVTPAIEGVAIAGGGAIESSAGFPPQNSIGAAVEGGGEIDIRNIDATSADAAVNGGGSIKLKAERTLEAAVDGGGEIRYWGDPKVTSAIDGGGEVSKGG